MYKCSKCKRQATARLKGYDWMCTYHFNKLVKMLRILKRIKHPNKCIHYSCLSNYGGYCEYNRALTCDDSNKYTEKK